MNVIENLVLYRLSQMFVVYFARVESYAGDSVAVTPLFKNEYGKKYESLTVPIFGMGGGDASVDFPLKRGDIVPCLTIKKDVSQHSGTIVENKRIDFFHNLADTIALNFRLQSKSSAEERLAFSFGGTKIVLEKDKIVLHGNVEIVGEARATSKISSDVDVEAAGVSFVKHVHGGVGSGSAKTAPPDPMPSS